MASKLKLKNNLGNTFTLEHSNDIGDVSLTSTQLKNIRQVDTIADLRAMTDTQNTIWVSGYHTKDDGAFGSNIFRWNSSSTEDDNGGTVIKLDSIETGRYELQYSGAVNVKWFGVSSSKTAIENTSSLQNAIEYSESLVVDIDIEVEATTSTYCLINTHHNLKIESNNKSTISFAGTGRQIIRSDGFNNISLIGLKFKGVGTNSSDLGAGLIQINNGDNILIKDCIVNDSDQDGVAISQCTDVVVIHNKFDNNSKSSLYLSECSRATVFDNTISNSGGHLVSANIVGSGIQLSGNTNIDCFENKVIGGLGYGIYVSQSLTIKPFSNNIINNSISNVNNPTNSKSSSGIYLANASADKYTNTTVKGNTVKGCGSYNVYAENHNQVTISENILIASEQSNLVVSTILGCVAKDNIFINTNTSNTTGRYALHLINDADEVLAQNNTYISNNTLPTGYGSDSARDDSTGTNLISNKNVVRVTLSSNWTHTVSGSFLPISWDKAELNDADGWDITNPTRITVPKNVKQVQISANLQVSGATTGDAGIRFHKNGSVVSGSGGIRRSATAGGLEEENLQSSIIDVSENDYIECMLYQTTGSTVDVLSGSLSWFSVELII